MKNINLVKIFRVVILVIAVAIITFSGIKIIPATDLGVVTRFGKYDRTLSPGLRFIIPFMDKLYKVPVTTVQKEEFGFRTSTSGERNEYNNSITHESLMLTGDLNIINIEWVVQYKIIDPKAWLFNVASSVRNKTIRDVSKAVVNELVGDRAIIEILGSERDRIQMLAPTLMNKKYEQLGIGISVSSVQLQNIVPPSEVQVAFEDVNIAVQDMNRLINEGKEAYNKEIPKVKGEADKMIQQARGYAAERTNMAQGDVARFNAIYTEYIKAPEVTRRRLYLETIGEVFANSKNLIIVDKNLKNFLPLKEIKKGE